MGGMTVAGTGFEVCVCLAPSFKLFIYALKTRASTAVSPQRNIILLRAFSFRVQEFSGRFRSNVNFVSVPNNFVLL